MILNVDLASEVPIYQQLRDRIVEAIAGFSGPGPTIFNSGQPSFIKSGRPLGQLACPKNPRMIGRDAHESHDRQRQPPWRQIMPAERSPRHDHREDSQKQASIPHSDVNFLVVCNPRLASVSTTNVFFRGQHWLKM